MPRKLTLEERKFILKRYWKTENAQDVIRDWNHYFNTDPPTRLAIYKLRDKFDDTGSVADAPRSGRPSVCTEQNLTTDAEAYARSSKKSLRRASAEIGIKRTSLHKILTKLHMRPYIPRLIHGLLEDDPDRRSQFCQQFVRMCEDNPTFVDEIVWTDEATFKLSGHVNRHNCVYWSDTNPQFTITSQLNQPGITVWAGISSDGIVGPQFFDGTVTGERYLDKLRNVIVPALKQRPDFNKLYFQQDGAPPHYATAVQNLLDETFPDKWIGRRGPIEFPPRSPDITPMDFFVWGVIKDSVYSRKPRSVEDLRQFVIDAFANLDHDLCTKVCHSVVSRCRECIEAEGLQFEYLS